MNVRVHIDRLVVDGIPLTAGQAIQLREAVQLELTRLLSTGSLPASLLQGGDVARLHGGAVALGSENRPARLGAQVGGALHGVLIT